MKNKLFLKGLQTLIKYSATKYCSCSVEASKFLFGNRIVSQKKVEIVKNGIDINYFASREHNSRNNVLNELNFPENAKVIGHVGKFSVSKNHIHILKVLKKLREKDKKYKAVLIGDGPLRKQIEDEVNLMGLSEHIRFLGVREDIPRLFKAMDVFLFPSLFEGFGLVAIEAQCTGTPCVISDAVPRSTDMGLGLVSYVQLNEDVNAWCGEINTAILKNRPDKKTILNQITKRGYNIRNNIDDWLRLYGLSPN